MNPLPPIIRPGQPGYRQCTRTLMDTTDPEIRFGEDGASNWVDVYEQLRKGGWNPEGNPVALDGIVRQIKQDGRGKKYDCILGLSGGLDSSYLALVAHRAGLRPLVFHTDTGWNTELAVNNIESIVRKCGFSLHTHVINWNEMADVQKAFLRAGVPNQDIPQDHSIFAAFYAFAARNDIRWILSGSNHATESILPPAWGYDARDVHHLKAVHRRFGERPIGKFPRMGHFRFGLEFRMLRGMKITKLLNLVPYHRRMALQELSQEMGWRYYGAKHFESRWTRFFQAHWLPTFFGYDKRLAHFSSLIVNGEMTKTEAAAEAAGTSYGPAQRAEDMDVIARKLQLKGDEAKLLTAPEVHSHFEYPTSREFTRLLMALRGRLGLKR